MTTPAIQRTLDAVWRIESARIVATLAKMTGDVGVAEDLAQEALVDALTQWPESGVPDNPGAWLTAVAKRKAIDSWRRRERLDDRYRAIAHNLKETTEDEWEPIPDDVLRLIFIACHPVLSREGQVALTLRTVGGLTTEEIARMLLIPVATVQQRIVRAKKTLAAAKVPFDTPEPGEWGARLNAVLGVLYLIFTEGYAATTGDRWIRTEVANEALRLGRVLAGLLPREPEVHGLLALMEFQASRFAARVNNDGSPVLLPDQNRARWDRTQISRGVAALKKAAHSDGRVRALENEVPGPHDDGGTHRGSRDRHPAGHHPKIQARVRGLPGPGPFRGAESAGFHRHGQPRGASQRLYQQPEALPQGGPDALERAAV